MEPNPPTLTRRRAHLRLPRRWPHLVGAFATLLGVVGLPVALTATLGSSDDAKPFGSVAVAELPAGERPSPLDMAEADLPDLLAADVLIGDNPTDDLVDRPATDALGNPITRSASGAPSPKTIIIPEDKGNALAPIDPSLSRDSRFGSIPAPNAQGLTPLRAYRRPANLPPGRRPVSIVVGGLGINNTLTQRAISELPADVTLSFAAHAPDLQRWIDAARTAGHEVLLEVPMESAGFDANEPGADKAIRVDASLSDNRDNLHRLLTRGRGYAGVINYNGDRVLTRSDVAAPVLSELAQSGLGFVHDGSFEAPTLPALAQSVDIPFALSFGLIDPSADRAVIDARLSELSAAARSQNGAIGVGFAYPQTIDALKGWIATLSVDGLALVPATATLQ